MILIYLKEDYPKRKELLSILKKYDPDYKEIGDNHLDQVITKVFSSEEKPTKHEEFEDFLFLDTLSPEKIQQLSKEFSENKIHLGRVAVRTEKNVSWKLRDLMSEVDEEFRYFRLRDALFDIVTHPDKGRLDKDPDYMRTMSFVYSLLEDTNTSIEDLYKAMNMLERKDMIQK